MSMPTQAFVDAMVRRDFPMFIGRAMAELEPGTPYSENRHVLHLAYQLEQVRLGSIKRLMINMPPRSLKTHISSIAYAAWVLGHDPGKRIICVTYSHDLARAQALQFKRLVTSDWYKRAFPELSPAFPNKLMDWNTSKGGYRFATSIEGSVLGRGADIIIIDDPNKGQEIYSQVARDRVKSAYDNVISSRLNHPKESAIICVMQRLHEDDLAGHMMQHEDWTVVKIPAVAVADEHWDLGGGQSYHREAGEPLQPLRMGHAELAVRKRQMGLTMYEAQYQQSPVPTDGIVIKREWLRYYDTEPADFAFRLASWDTASTLSENADWSVGTVWGVSGGRIYLLHVERARLEVPALRHRIEDIHRRFRVDQTIIEDADLGRGIVQDLRLSSAICVPIAIPVRIEKSARMQARSVMFETEKVLIPSAAEWLPAYLQELLGFPNARHDDQVDSTSQALDFLQQRFARQISPELEERSTRRPLGRNRPKGARLP
ncbi:MAG: phage terminase large subunit [Alphaproteobacteria bacterium]|nr:phage terminase large subunit [Alphaproteobacteria bacterium]MBU0875867.1 phage terminase large subunit [Alphaproteobacteria bacterium]MBU1769953.1 phage terminase large subunit [Alphaproteobacteria bacterium]